MLIPAITLLLGGKKFTVKVEAATPLAVAWGMEMFVGGRWGKFSSPFCKIRRAGDLGEEGVGILAP